MPSPFRLLLTLLFSSPPRSPINIYNLRAQTAKLIKYLDLKISLSNTKRRKLIKIINTLHKNALNVILMQRQLKKIH